MLAFLSVVHVYRLNMPFVIQIVSCYYLPLAFNVVIKVFILCLHDLACFIYS